MATKRRDPESQGSWGDRAFSLRGEIEDPADGAVYRVTRFVGRGGMGEVYEVTRGDTGARFALKCLQLQYAGDPRTIERTRREALTLRDLRHPNVVHVHAIGVREDGLIWMVMDLLVGHTLGEIQKRFGRLPLPWALSVGAAVADGLGAAGLGLASAGPCASARLNSAGSTAGSVISSFGLAITEPMAKNATWVLSPGFTGLNATGADCTPKIARASCGAEASVSPTCCEGGGPLPESCASESATSFLNLSTRD